MKNFKTISDLTPAACLNPWRASKNTPLGQILYDSVRAAYGLNQTNTVELIFKEDYISVEEVDKILHEHTNTSCQYLFLAVNKFLIHTQIDRAMTGCSFDLSLLQHWQALLDWQPVYIHYIENDNGLSGNFVFPVTQMLLKKQ